MDYDKPINDLRWWAEHCDRTNYGCQVRTFLRDAATAIEALRAENEKLRKERDEARVDCAVAEKNHANCIADLARVTEERDAAVADMEALMWFSGEGCRICAHAVEVHKEPYVRLDCDREKGTDCSPKWRGIKKED